MSVIKIPLFAGMVPALDKHMLDAKNSQNSVNAFMYSGALRGLAEAVRLNDTDFLSKTRYAHRIPLNDGDPSYLYDSYWLEFENIDTDVINAPTSGDQYERIYWTSPSEPPTYNTKQRIIDGQHPFLLGIPEPGNISVSVSGGSSTTMVTRAYISTLVSAYGEEGPASKPKLLESEKEDATFAVTVAAVDPDDMGPDRNIATIRLYRTIVSLNGTANYYLVHEFPADDVPQTFNDTITDEELADNVILESIAWTGPPDLEGWSVMPNGIVVGWIGKDLYFSEPYRPHAWPVAYSLSLNFEIIGIAVIGQTAVICTKGNPYTASGVNSFAVTTSMLASFEPCISKGSIVPTEEGVYYMSPNGLILVNAGRAENITKQFISRDFWNKMTVGAKMNAARFGPAYYAVAGIVDRAFQTNENNPTVNAFQIFEDIADPGVDIEAAFQTEASEGSSKGFMVDPTNVNMGCILLENSDSISSIYNDYYSSELIFIQNRAAWWLDRRPGFKTISYLWKSKAFQSPEKQNFSAMKVFFYVDDVEDNNEIVPSGPQQFSVIDPDTGAYVPLVYDPNTQYGIVRVFADFKEIYAAELREPGQLMRLPSGYKAEFWEVELVGRNKIKSVQMATTVKELSVA